MMIKFIRFNIYLLAALGLLLAVTGCQSSRKKKNLTTIEFHLEVNRDGAQDNEPVPIFREQPVYVNVDKEAFLDGADVTEARLVDELGGFKIQVKFDWRGTTLLGSVTAANRGKRLGVLCSFPAARWLAAPVIRKQISDGVFSFTPDATREEAERIVEGLNDVAAELKKKEKF